MKFKKAPLAHHFSDLSQQYDSAVLGMWLFLVTEVLFFGGLFAAYGVYRWMYPDAFKLASNHLDVVLGAINTVVLISSSLTMALAVNAAKLNRNKELKQFLGLTLILALVFMGIKAVEYSHKFHEHMVPGKHFQFLEYPGPGSELFFSCYFGMTGLHALHMVIGIVIIVILLIRASKGVYSEKYYTPIDLTGLYWHFVDIVWIFLFPLLYLIGRH